MGMAKYCQEFTYCNQISSRYSDVLPTTSYKTAFFVILNHGILFIEKETIHMNIIEGLILGSVKEKKKKEVNTRVHIS